jgi:hypothetical protein
MELSPAFSITSDMTDEELDLYFATCGSLSNLPTPPPAKEHATKKLASTTSDQHEFAPKLQGQLPTIQRRTITRATFLLKDKFVVGLEHVGLARQSDVPLHASTKRLVRRHCSPISFFSANPHSTVCLSIDVFFYTFYWTRMLTTIFSTSDPSCQPCTAGRLHNPTFCPWPLRVLGTVMPTR